MATVTSEGMPLIIGHEWAVQLIRHSLASGCLSQAYLLAGPPRIGKTSVALYLARAVNCLDDDPKARPCGTCSACRKIGRGRHPDVRVIDGQEDGIKIDQIRELQSEIILSPFEARRRVYILRDFQKATLGAANCLLKTLEEPPPSAVLVLTAIQAEMLLPTVVSRCQVLHLRPLPVSQVQEALQTHWGVDPHQARLLARVSEGRIGWALNASGDEALLQNRDKYLIALEQVLQQNRTERMSLAQQLSRNASALPDVFDLWQSWWRDVLLAKSGNEHALTNVDREQTVRIEAQSYTLEQIRACLHAIRRAAQQVEQHVNPRMALEVLFLNMPRR
ncbi:MAG TPA: DNA polymerase III subunit [Anaerolineae bacterium]|nr:DNA polymerase III subunit [Anaerolineae bacterium]